MIYLTKEDLGIQENKNTFILQKFCLFHIFMNPDTGHRKLTTTTKCSEENSKNLGISQE